MSTTIKETDIIVIGAGPTGLFTVFEAGLLGLKCILIDNLDKVGGQCAELYPDKPIYDIPGIPIQTAEELVNALLKQIKPFEYSVYLQQRVESLIEHKNDTDQISEWTVTTSENNQFKAKNVFIAAGAGSFEPRRPPNIKNPDKYMGKGVSYSVKDKGFYSNKNLIIFGGGDSALDWSVELANIASSVTLVHRRDEFRGAPNTESQMRKLVNEGKVLLKTPYVIDSLIGEDSINGVSVKNFETKQIEDLECDEIIFLFGLHKKLGPIVDWNLELENNKITVDTKKFESNTAGIFAVGDISDYPGKLNLILSGFHETTLAVRHAFKRCFPEQRVPFRYTTTDTKLQKKLGVIE
jgi:thioredoxin reductase (NADPH)